MGTNYYAYKYTTCDCGALKGDVVHIGKSSGGWRFLFNANGLTSYRLVDILKHYDKFDVIKDEYGRKVSIDELQHIVIDKSNGKEHEHKNIIREKDYDLFKDEPALSLWEEEFC